VFRRGEAFSRMMGCWLGSIHLRHGERLRTASDFPRRAQSKIRRLEGGRGVAAGDCVAGAGVGVGVGVAVGIATGLPVGVGVAVGIATGLPVGVGVGC
jgi:hypothetical protein